jgi:arylsulfatase A-like enzyme
MTQRPNFVYIMTDQHRSDWLGCYGHPVVKTPNIDALAENGTRFDNFFVASPVCMPNRASFMTGRYPSVHGLRYNGCVMPEGTNTFVDVLAASGYKTASIGKSHLQPFTGIDNMNKADETGGVERPILEAMHTEGVSQVHEEPVQFKGDDTYALPTPYYGYQHVDLVTGHGHKCGGQYAQWLRRERVDWADFFAPENELPHEYTCPQVFRTPLPEDLYPTGWVGNRAVEYLNTAAGSDDPFFAFVSFPDPHHPFNPPGKYWDMYSPDQFDVPLPFSAHENPIPPMAWLEEAFKEGGDSVTPQTAFRVSDQHIKEAMALTAGMITMIDDQVGKIVETLKANGQYENTVICFNSDHGDYLGDFGLLLKGMFPSRATTQVPMIWSDPATRNGRVSHALANTVDLAPTILERAGLAPFRGTQGRSLLRALNGDDDLRDEVLTEYNEGMPKFGLDEPVRVRSLRSHDWRFTIYLDQEFGELYDLNADPNETRNLWDSADHREVRGDLALRMSHHLTRQMDESPRALRLA